MQELGDAFCGKKSWRGLAVRVCLVSEDRGYGYATIKSNLVSSFELIYYNYIELAIKYKYQVFHSH